MKPCTICAVIKAASEFQVRKASNDGRTAACRSCLHKRDRERYPKEKKRRAEQYRIYAQNHGKKVIRRIQQKWLESNAIKRAAHITLGNAVRDGKVKRQPCWVCGAKAVAHHPDYDQPLDVVWLCQAHHKEVHRG